MTALGLVEGVSRVLYRDTVLNQSVYPLDEKVDLLNITDGRSPSGSRSRYTQVFAWNAAKVYAELTETESVSALTALLGIEINKTQLVDVAQAVAEHYIPVVSTDTPNKQPDVESAEEADEGHFSEPCPQNELCYMSSEGFLADKMREIDAMPNREAVIQAAIDGKLNGAEGTEATKSALYLLADGTGVPGLSRELSDKGKNGGRAGTFEAKIGSAFQQGFSTNGLPVLENGNIVRIPNTTKYTGTTDKIDGFSPQFTEFALRNGMADAAQVVFLSDGAPWLWNMQKNLCPNAIAIVDFFHAAEHLEDVIGSLYFYSSEKREEFAGTCRSLLERGEIEQLAMQIRNKATLSNAQTIDKKLAYFERNADRMRYGLFRAAGLFIGSGVMEAACKTIVGKRLKNAGMHWSMRNAKGLIALRCAICSNEFQIPNSTPLAA